MKKKYYFLAILIFLMFAYSLTFLRVNISDSTPLGIYVVLKDRDFKKNDYVIFEEPKEYQKYVRENLKNIDSVKKIYAVAGDCFEIKNNDVYVNNKLVGKIKYNIPIKIKDKYILKENEFIVFSNKDDSLDSRYYGVINKINIKYKTKILWKWSD